LVAKLRRAGASAEVFASGSPRKRYDRAKKSNPAAIVSLDIRDGAATNGFKLLDPDSETAKRAQALVEVQ